MNESFVLCGGLAALSRLLAVLHAMLEQSSGTLKEKLALTTTYEY
jgi:hypothetical protein